MKREEYNRSLLNQPQLLFHKVHLPKVPHSLWWAQFTMLSVIKSAMQKEISCQGNEATALSLNKCPGYTVFSNSSLSLLSLSLSISICICCSVPVCHYYLHQASPYLLFSVCLLCLSCTLLTALALLQGFSSQNSLHLCLCLTCKKGTCSSEEFWDILVVQIKDFKERHLFVKGKKTSQTSLQQVYVNFTVKLFSGLHIFCLAQTIIFQRGVAW